MLKLLVALAIAVPALAFNGGHCPPVGPLLPPPTIAAKFDPGKLSSNLESMLKRPAFKWNTSTTSFSVGLTSTNGTFFEFHHTADIRDKTGVKTVDGNSVYRIMSVTKLFNVLTLMLNAPPGGLDTPITKYIPELNGVKDYESITLRMLASQSGGVPRDGFAFDMFNENGEGWEAGGFPKPDPKDIAPCDNIGGSSCTRAQFFDNLLRNKLAWQAGDKASYSDQAFTLLGWAMQNMTGKPFETLLRDTVTGPLGMSVTGFTDPERSRGIIPVGPGAAFWGLNLTNFNPTAGLYSSPNEILTFARAILNHKFLSAADTRFWMRPAGFAGSYTMAVGAPWEIFRVGSLTPDNRPIDIYTKSGSMPGWAAYIFFLPDYNIGGNIHVTGEDAGGPSEEILDVVTTSLVPAMESLARQQAKSLYAGRYAGGDAKQNCNNASLELIIDNGPGLKIKSWRNDGKSILDAIAKDKGINATDLHLRLYPIGEGNRWRMSTEKSKPTSDTIKKPSEACINWFLYDQMRYASFPIDEFDFDVKDGKVIGVKNPGMRANLTKRL